MRAAWLQTGLLALLCAAATGCHHKQKVAVVPAPPPAVVPLAPAPEPPLVASVPLQPTPVPEVKVPPKKIRKPRKKIVVPPPPPPVEVAVAGPAPAPGAVIGALTAGGDATPQKQQRAHDLWMALERRLNGLSPDLITRQHDGITRVRNFEREAKKSLDSGDAEGAITLTTKAGLLLDDLLR